MDWTKVAGTVNQALGKEPNTYYFDEQGNKYYVDQFGRTFETFTITEKAQQQKKTWIYIAIAAAVLIAAFILYKFAKK